MAELAVLLRLRRRGAGAVLVLGALVLSGCGGASSARSAHDTSEHQLPVAELRLELADSRPPPAGDRLRLLELPADFAARAQIRLSQLARGDGERLEVRAVVLAAQATELVDARGEMTRVEVDLDFETRVSGGPVLKRGRGHAQQDIPRDEAEDAELARVLDATALDALERYWSSDETLAALKRELAAYGAARRDD
ncbi:MAG: hypothetical protein ABW217_22350 [Polyangiaceae bacterium]